MELLARIKACDAMPKAKFIITPISGDMSIAPITTALLFILRPMEAMRIAKINIYRLEPLTTPPSDILLSISNMSTWSTLR